MAGDSIAEHLFYMVVCGVGSRFCGSDGVENRLPSAFSQVDSVIGRTVAVMLGSTETTFYTISVYFGAAGIKRTRYTVPAALIADLTGFLVASLAVRIFF